MPRLTWKEWRRSGRERYRDSNGTDKIKTAWIDVVATIPGSNELQWLDVTIRRPTAQTNVEEAAMTGGHAAWMGEKEKTKKVRKQERSRPGHGETDKH